MSMKTTPKPKLQPDLDQIQVLPFAAEVTVGDCRGWISGVRIQDSILYHVTWSSLDQIQSAWIPASMVHPLDPSQASLGFKTDMPLNRSGCP